MTRSLDALTTTRTVQQDELKEILILTLMTILTQLLLILPCIISYMFAGHVSNDDMNATGLGTSILNIMIFGIIMGLSTAADTIFSQINGSLRRSSLGIVAQRTCLLYFLINLLQGSILVHTYSILQALGHSQVNSIKTHWFIMACLPGLPGYSVLMVEIKYLQSQKMVKPCFLCGIVANFLHMGYSYVLVIWLNLGSTGGGIAISITFCSWALLLLAYIVFSQVYTETWTGFSMESLDNWGSFLVLALPGALMLMLESLCIEIYALLAAYMGSSDLTVYLIPTAVHNVGLYGLFGASVAATVQIGNYMGAKEEQKARTSAVVCIVIAVALSFLFSTLVLLFHQYIPLLFCTDEQIIARVETLLLWLSLERFIAGIELIEGGILRACGKHLFVTIVYIFAFGTFAIPLGVYLMFYTETGVSGTSEILMLCTVFVILMSFSTKLYYTDWKLETENALVRVENNTKYGYRKLVRDDDKLTKTSNDKNKEFVYKCQVSLVFVIKVSVCTAIFITSFIVSE